MIKIILLAYLLLINIITYFTYAADKTKARQNKWRIPERTLILLALLGGSPAALLAMSGLQIEIKSTTSLEGKWR